MKVAVFLLSAYLAPSWAEMIFRGQCSRVFQSQELGITVDMSDVILNRYVIRPLLVAKNQQDCASKCLSASTPPCRSAIYEPYNKSCTLTRADKQTILEFDKPSGAALPIRGLVIVPQAITDTVSDRINGVPGCDQYCPAPAKETSQSITPVCIKDCANSVAVCAGEENGCSDYPRRVYFTSTQTTNGFLHSVVDWRMYTWQKRFDYTNIRIIVSIANWYYSDTSRLAYEGGKVVFRLNGNPCYGDLTDVWQEFGKDILTKYNHPGVRFGESIYGDIICLQTDQASGSYTAGMSIYRDSTVVAYTQLGVGIGGLPPPIFVYAEEFIPAKWHYKMDDTARCQSATLFNTVSKLFTDYYGNNLYGLTPFRISKYKKRSDTSTLRVYWGGRLYFEGWAKCVHIYVTINDRLCKNPYPIEQTWYQEVQTDAGDECRTEQGLKTINIEGICRDLPAGRYDIALWMDTACVDYTDPNNYWYITLGHGRPSHMIVEEIHENNPINVMLLNDGTQVRMPYYNRQYFAWDDNCRHNGGWGSGAHTANCVANPMKTFTFNKLQSDSALHVRWYGGQEFCFTGMWYDYYEAVKWYVRFNGAECTTPAGIESWFMDWNSDHGICMNTPKMVEGICQMPIAAGPVTIDVQIGFPSPSYTSLQHAVGAGRGGPSYLMVEEIYPNQ